MRLNIKGSDCYKQNVIVYCPGPDKDLSINFFLEKQSHHLEGLPSSAQNTFSQIRTPVSCLSCCKYWRITSESK